MAVLSGLCLAAWSATLVHLSGIASLSPSLSISLRGIFAVSAAVGWLAGNLYTARRRAPSARRLLAYLLMPPGLPCLLWAASPSGVPPVAPQIPLLCLGVSCVFFTVPLWLPGRRP